MIQYTPTGNIQNVIRSAREFNKPQNIPEVQNVESIPNVENLEIYNGFENIMKNIENTKWHFTKMLIKTLLVKMQNM